MSYLVFFSVLFAALLHASWNAIIKTGGPKLTGMFILTLVQGLFGVAVAALYPLPPSHVWPWLAASGIFHSAYKLFLAYAYEQGDLSRVYPIARGAAPLVVLLVGLFLLPDVIAVPEALGIVLLGTGILMMARGAFTNGESARLVPLALGSAMATAGYSMVDGMGARAWGLSQAYVAWLFVLDMILFSVIVFFIRGRDVARASPRNWIAGGIAAFASYGAYAIAVWAMTQAPIALVAALRETSILFAVLIGWMIFGERLDRMKGIAALLIVGGVMLTRLA